MSVKPFHTLVARAIFFAILFLVSTAPPIARAASYVVTKTADTNDGTCDADCSLREAITEANANAGADTITFNIPDTDGGCSFANVCTITLSAFGTLPAIDDDLTIDGSQNAAQITISGAYLYRVMMVNSGKTLGLNALTIANGYIFSGFAGGIWNYGTLNLTNSTLDTNYASSGGGGILNEGGTVNIAGSTFSGNNGGSGGAIYNLGGTYNIANSAFSGNFANNGGVLFNFDTTANITNSAFSGNYANNGGVVYNLSGTLNLKNSILTNTSTGGDCFNGATITGSDNLIDDTTCGSSVSFRLGAVTGFDTTLADHGGATQTFKLNVDSNAIDAVPSGECTYVSNGTNPLFNDGDTITMDQRAVTRPQGLLCDVGAFERLMPTFAPGGVNDAMLWLRSDMGVTGSPVSQWADQSASSFIANGAPTEQPAFFGNTFNGNPGLQFDGSNDQLIISSGILGSGSYTDGNVYLVVRTNTVQSSYTFFEAPGGGQQQFSTHTPWSDNNIYLDFPYPANRISVNWGGSTGVPYLWSLLASTTSTPLGNNKHIVRDGTSLANDNSSTTLLGNGSPFHVGTGFDGTWHFYNGDYAELVVFLAPLTAAQHNQIESYLATKYGITLGSTSNLISYTASDGSTVFWTGDATYQNDVAGIGHDDGSKLDQRVSSSVNPAPQPKIANGAALDNTNPGTNTAFSADLSFVMWGSNAGTTTLDVPVSASGVNTRIARVWKTEVTGSGAAASLTLQIPDSIFGGNTNPSLLISADPTFASVTRAPIALTCSLGACTATFNRFTAGEYFTFAAQVGTTAVNVNGVNARVNAQGNVVVKWRTTTESQIAGFNVYRKTGKGEWKQINASFIQAKHAGSAEGNKYRFADKKVTQSKTYRYKIEVKYLDNHSEWTKVVKVKKP